MVRNSVSSLSPAGRTVDYHHILHIEMLNDRCVIIVLVVHVVTVTDLARTAVAAPVVRDDAIALPNEIEHLSVPVIGTQRPAMMEGDWLRVPGAPILEVNLDPVFGGDGVHWKFSFPDEPVKAGS